MFSSHWMTTRNYDEAGPLLKNKTIILMIPCKCICYANNHIYIYIHISTLHKQASSKASTTQSEQTPKSSLKATAREHRGSAM